MEGSRTHLWCPWRKISTRDRNFLGSLLVGNKGVEDKRFKHITQIETGGARIELCWGLSLGGAACI